MYYIDPVDCVLNGKIIFFLITFEESIEVQNRIFHRYGRIIITTIYPTTTKRKTWYSTPTLTGCSADPSLYYTMYRFIEILVSTSLTCMHRFDWDMGDWYLQYMSIFLILVSYDRIIKKWWVHLFNCLSHRYNEPQWKDEKTILIDKWWLQLIYCIQFV